VMLGLLAWLLTSQSTIPTTVRETAAKMANLELPGGVKISVPEGSFNYSVYQWLTSTTDTAVPKRFVFDNLNFDTGSTKLTPESVPTIESLVAIMKAYPNVQFQLEGHTDNTGDAVANNQLSTDRANAVKGMMVKTGIAEGRISIAGYGQDKSIASNDTEEGRAKNRRIELVIVRR
jgi:OmpA-OmpF porin, OOP family